MPRASYRIIPIDESFYEVRVDEPNAGQRTVTGFQSIAEAEHWIETQKRHEAGIGQVPPRRGFNARKGAAASAARPRFPRPLRVVPSPRQ